MRCNMPRRIDQLVRVGRPLSNRNPQRVNYKSIIHVFVTCRRYNLDVDDAISRQGRKAVEF